MPWSGEVEARLLLSDFLRSEVGLTGTHVGCEHGVCGACTVQLDGEPVRACLIFAVQIDGHEVTTVEGLAATAPGEAISVEQLHPIQQALHEAHGLQCGFCTPGILMTAEAFLRENPAPSREEIREAVSGHLCRCTGYHQHRGRGRARGRAPRGGRPRRRQRGRALSRAGGTWVGARVPRNEDARLLTGRAQFVEDVEPPGALHVAFVRSDLPAGRLRRLDVESARRHPGVHAVFTADDLGPLLRPGAVLVPPPPLEGLVFHARTALPLVRDRIRHQGEALAMIVAESRYVAEDAAQLVEADIEPFDPVVDLGRALDDDAPRIHDDLPSNLAAYVRQAKGDYAAARARADLVLERRLSYDRGIGGAIENRAVVAEWDARADRLQVWDTTQAPIPVRNVVAAALGLSESQVRFVAPFVGGGFGPKIMFYAEEILVPWASIQLGRPVKWVEDRYENFFATTQERGQLHEAEIAVTREGPDPGRAGHLHPRLRSVRPLRSHDPHQHPVHASRALPGAELRERVPRRLHEQASRHAGAGGGTAARRVRHGAAARPRGPRPRPRSGRDPPPQRDPLGRVSLQPRDHVPGLRPAPLRQRELRGDAGGGRPSRRPRDVPAGTRTGADGRARGRRRRRQLRGGTGIGPYEGARITVEPGGTVRLATGVGTQGQGHFTSFAQIVADAIGVKPSDVRVVTGDTSDFHWGTGTFASRGAVVAGNAIHAAALSVREKILKHAAEALEVDPDDLELAEAPPA